MLSDTVDKARSIEELEGVRWPDPPSDSTSLVRSVHTLRKRPLGALSTEDMGRLIGQDVGLRWLLPLALDHLRTAAAQDADVVWLDDDLLTAVVTRKAEVWRDRPELARHLDETIRILPELSPYLRPDVEAFRSAATGLL
ncbi:contact-dependent growth inhibition system immunity protein [Streptomyces fragilis]|uniref:Contact-dependent growth inhibition system immunity protein n=1 Tax=Streptomyces fragilis TaxID=67301 RepID=A0ABV2YQ10_9ACTN|nr:contact-dependent growth inhibition system immunity protein [Streptomyces fragilis]